MMEEATYSFGGAAKILDIAESKLRYWAQVGFVGPSGRRGGKPVFSFQDLVSVKAAKELVDRGFKAAEIRKAIEGVRAAVNVAFALVLSFSGWASGSGASGSGTAAAALGPGA